MRKFPPGFTIQKRMNAQDLFTLEKVEMPTDLLLKSNVIGKPNFDSQFHH